MTSAAPAQLLGEVVEVEVFAALVHDFLHPAVLAECRELLHVLAELVALHRGAVRVVDDLHAILGGARLLR